MRCIVVLLPITPERALHNRYEVPGISRALKVVLFLNSSRCHISTPLSGLMQRIDESVPTSKTPSSVNECHLASSLSGIDHICLVSARAEATLDQAARRLSTSQ